MAKSLGHWSLAGWWHGETVVIYPRTHTRTHTAREREREWGPRAAPASQSSGALRGIRSEITHNSCSSVQFEGRIRSKLTNTKMTRSPGRTHTHTHTQTNNARTRTTTRTPTTTSQPSANQLLTTSSRQYIILVSAPDADNNMTIFHNSTDDDAKQIAPVSYSTTVVPTTEPRWCKHQHCGRANTSTMVVPTSAPRSCQHQHHGVTNISSTVILTSAPRWCQQRNQGSANTRTTVVPTSAPR